MKNKKIYRTEKEASADYYAYITDHIENVKKAFDIFKNIIYDDIISKRKYQYEKEYIYQLVELLVEDHDKSKLSKEEFDNYRKHFYPCESDEEDSYDYYTLAWHHHYMNNKHHPEYWSVIKDGKLYYLYMPNIYFFEMLCDWISVSMVKNSSLHEWWFNTDRGRNEKQNMFPKEDVKLIDYFIIKYKDTFDFCNSSK